MRCRKRGVALAVADGALLLAGGGGALAVALDVHLQDDDLVDEAVDGGEHHGGIGEDGRPLSIGVQKGPPRPSERWGVGGSVEWASCPALDALAGQN